MTGEGHGRSSANYSTESGPEWVPGGLPPCPMRRAQWWEAGVRALFLAERPQPGGFLDWSLSAALVRGELKLPHLT